MVNLILALKFNKVQVTWMKEVTECDVWQTSNKYKEKYKLYKNHVYTDKMQLTILYGINSTDLRISSLNQINKQNNFYLLNTVFLCCMNMFSFRKRL